MFKKALHTSFLLLFIANAIVAQMPGRIVFDNLTKKEGLASEVVFSTVQDKTGYLWIATQNGLQRYDGKRFFTFRHLPGDTTTLPSNSVSHLFIDSKNRLWLMFDKTVGIFNTSRFTFSEKKITPSVMIIKKMIEDETGQLILFTEYNKHLIYDERKNQFVNQSPLPAFPSGFTSGDMAVQRSNNLYWITGKEGLLAYDFVKKQYQYAGNNASVNPVIENLGTIKNTRLPFIAIDGSFWMVSWIPFGNIPTIYCFDKTKNNVLQFENIKGKSTKGYYEVWGIYQQHNGVLWVYGMGLLAYYNESEQRFIVVKSEPQAEYGIEYDYVSNVFEDREKNVWVSTDKGLHRFNVGAQVFANVLNHRVGDTAEVNVPASAVVQTKSDGIWVSTWGAGIFSYNDKWQAIPNPVQQRLRMAVVSHMSYMIQRRNEEIWIGSRTGDIIIYEPGADRLTPTHTPLERNDAIRQLVEDNEGNIWVGSNNGVLLKCAANNPDKAKLVFTSVMSDFGDILRLYLDKNNFLWVCTAGNGVYKIDKNTNKIIQHYTESKGADDGLQNEGATDILQYNDSIFLIASNTLCILNSHTNKFTYLTSADGLPAENIVNIISDKEHRIWLALSGGLYRLNLEKKMHVSYGVADGISYNVFEPASSAILKDGRLVIGSSHDLLVFDPAATIDTGAVPSVTITAITFSGSAVTVDSVFQAGVFTLPYDNSSFIIDVSTLSFKSAYKMYYMLAGLNDTWVPVSANGQINYPYLPPGDYTLKIKALNGEGVESGTITSLAITVNKPFWKNWLFYSMLALLVGGLIFWFDKERLKRKEALQNMRTGIADNLHKDISVALSDINVLSEMAKMKAGTEPQKSKEFIEQIHNKSGNMINAMDDMLWAIAPENDSMQKALSRLNQQVDALRSTYDVAIDLLIDKKAEAINLNMKKRQDIFWLLKGGINNITRHGASNIRVHLGLEKQCLVYTLEFDTSNMNVLEFKNLLQRKELADRLKEVNGKMRIDAVKNNTVIELKIPV